MAYITLDQAKDHIRVDHTDDDIYIMELIDVAEAAVLNEISGRIFGLGTVTTNGTTALTGSTSAKFLEQASVGDTIKVTGETVRTISAVTSDTALTVSVAFSTSVSSLSYYITPSLLVNSDLPVPVKHAVLLFLGWLYENREPALIGTSVTKLPYTLDYLLAPYKNWVLA